MNTVYYTIYNVIDTVCDEHSIIYTIFNGHCHDIFKWTHSQTNSPYSVVSHT